MGTTELKIRGKRAAGHQGDGGAKTGESSTPPLLSAADWTDYRSLDTLPRKGGVSADRLAALVAKEVVDNALDAAGNASVELIGPNGFRVADGGPGIGLDDAGIAELFSVARPRLSSKLWRRPDRGALGNGLRVVAGAALATGGTVTVSTRGRTLRLTPQDDGTTRYEVVGAFAGAGTVVEVQLGPALPLNDKDLDWAQEAIGWAGVGPAYKGKPSPHWFSPAAFFELCQAQGPGETVHRFAQRFEGCSGRTAGEIAGHFPKGTAVCRMSRAETAELLRLAKGLTAPVAARRLGSLGKPADGTPYARVETTLNVNGAAVPAVVEVYAAAADRMSAEVLVNRTPVVEAVYGSLTKDVTGKPCLWVQGCGLDGGLKATGKQPPCRLTISVIAPAVPLTSDGKSPDLGSAEDDVLDAVAKVAKKVKRGAAAAPGDRRQQVRVIWGAIPDAAAKASGGWKARFSIRQLFYNVRPAVLLACGVELSYGYFCRTVTKYENRHGKVPLLYRDPRGVLIHPHTRQEIALGTLAVESYERPRWNFNKVLYIEKKGFFPALLDARFGERHDCALMSSDGYASGAVRDLIDLISEGDEEVTVFCVHDADAYGTGIYDALQYETETRPGRKFRIVDLGLNPAEAVGMAEAGRVEVERLKPGKRRKAVGRQVEPEWADWLQANRVELNALSTPDFLAWLDAKLAPHAGKVVPPPEVITGRLRERTRADLRRAISERILAEAGVEGLVERALADRSPLIDGAAGTIAGDVAEALAENPHEPWGAPVDRIAAGIAAADTPENGA